MKVKKLRKVLSKRFVYRICVDNNYVGRYNPECMRQFDDLKVKCVWTFGNGDIALNLVTKRK